MLRPRVLLLSAYDAISHRLWAQQCKAMLDDLEWTSLVGPARHFAWGLRGRPLQWFLDPESRALLQGDYELVIATSTVDLAAVFACAPSLATTPTLLYMHENQFTYPQNQSLRSELRRAHRVDACMVQLYALLAARRVVFNTAFHRASMREGVDTFLSMMPEKMDRSLLLEKIDQASVLAVPIEDAATNARENICAQGPLVIAWNHRWEFDKGPERFARSLELLTESGRDFRLILLGESFGKAHPAYLEILNGHSERILHHGMLERRDDYYRWLRKAQVALSTSLHDFQGLSMLEAAACGVWPLLPERLAYPEIHPSACLYPSFPGDPEREAQALCRALLAFDDRRKAGKCSTLDIVRSADKYKVHSLKSVYRRMIHELL